MTQIILDLVWRLSENNQKSQIFPIFSHKMTLDYFLVVDDNFIRNVKSMSLNNYWHHPSPQQTHRKLSKNQFRFLEEVCVDFTLPLFVVLPTQIYQNFLQQIWRFLSALNSAVFSGNLGNNWSKVDRNYKSAPKEIQIRHFQIFFKQQMAGHSMINVPALPTNVV